MVGGKVVTDSLWTDPVTFQLKLLLIK